MSYTTSSKQNLSTFATQKLPNDRRIPSYNSKSINQAIEALNRMIKHLLSFFLVPFSVPFFLLIKKKRTGKREERKKELKKIH